MVDNAVYGEDGGDDDLSMTMETYGEVKGGDLTPSAGGKSVNKEGRYHCMVVSVKKEKEKELEKARTTVKDGQCPHMSPPSVKIVFQVLAGDHEDQNDLMVYHQMYLWKWDAETAQFRLRAGKELKMHLQVCRGLGLCSQADVDAGVFAINFKNAVHKTCVLEVRKESFKKDDGSEGGSFRIPFGNVWLPDDDAVVDVPKDPEAMALYVQGKIAGGGTATTPQNLF